MPILTYTSTRKVEVEVRCEIFQSRRARDRHNYSSYASHLGIAFYYRIGLPSSPGSGEIKVILRTPGLPKNLGVTTPAATSRSEPVAGWFASRFKIPDAGLWGVSWRGAALFPQ